MRILAALALCLLLACPLAPAQAQTITPLFTSGPAANRLNLVVLSEGYTSAQLGQFLFDATNMVSTMLSYSPYREYSNYFNAYAISVASTDPGSSHPQDDEYPNTYFGSYYLPPDDTIIVIPSSGQQKVDALLASYMPYASLPVIIVNDGTPGGSDGFGKAALVAHSSMGPIMLTHETGHVLALLGDEYSHATYTAFPDVEEPNTTRAAERDQIKWKAWIAVDTPLPTPQTLVYADQVGLFQGAHYHTNGWYRPKLDCMMNHFGMDIPFCEVCSEALVKAIYRKTRPVESFSPAASRLTVGAGQSAAFSLSLLQPATHALSVQWYLDGFAQAGATNQSFNAPVDALGAGHQVRAIVSDLTPLVRNDPTNTLKQSITWLVNGGPSNLVRTLSFALIAYTQGAADSKSGAVKSAIASKDLLKALSQTTSNAAITAKSKLLSVTVLPSGAPSVVVRNVINRTNADIDVTDYFPQSVLAAVANLTIQKGRTNGTERSLRQFGFVSAPLAFSLQGVTATSFPSGAAKAVVGGSGAITNGQSVFSGNVTLAAGKIESGAGR